MGPPAYSTGCGGHTAHRHGIWILVSWRLRVPEGLEPGVELSENSLVMLYTNNNVGNVLSSWIKIILACTKCKLYINVKKCPYEYATPGPRSKGIKYCVMDLGQILYFYFFTLMKKQIYRRSHHASRENVKLYLHKIYYFCFIFEGHFGLAESGFSGRGIRLEIRKHSTGTAIWFGP